MSPKKCRTCHAKKVRHSATFATFGVPHFLREARSSINIGGLTTGAVMLHLKRRPDRRNKEADDDNERHDRQISQSKGNYGCDGALY